MTNDSRKRYELLMLTRRYHTQPLKKKKTNMKFNSVEFITRNFTDNKLK
jgi:hypothetical protein